MTTGILDVGVATLQDQDGAVSALLSTLWRMPGRFGSALRLAWRMSRRADRPLPIHLGYLAQACLARRWMRAHGARHLHAHFGTNPAEVAMLARVLGGPPYSFTVHGPGEFDMPQFIHLDEKIARAGFVAAISSYGRSQLYRWVPASMWHKVQIVRCGLEPAFHAGATGPSAASKRLVCVGRLNEQKGHQLLIEAAGRLAALGADFELVLAGDGELRAPIEARIAALGLQGRVRITGWIGSADVRREIEAARALVLPSFAEGLPVVLMEAMALRRPVVSTWVNGIPELVRQGGNGWLFAPGDLDALTAALRQCLAATPADLQRMGDAARAAVIARHDIDGQAAHLAHLIRAQASPDEVPSTAETQVAGNPAAP
jgi:glycosyltransferase involved in cell wall biosynthesis